MHTHSLAQYVKCFENDDWQGVGELMLSSARKLADSGADFLICPDNTIHRALPYVNQRSPLPWLHIAEVVAEQASERGFRRIGLTGTRSLVESERSIRKGSQRMEWSACARIPLRAKISRIIMDELDAAFSSPGRSLTCSASSHG